MQSHKNMNMAKSPPKRKRKLSEKRAAEIRANRKLIKVQLDSKTVITIPALSSLKAWIERYPNAKVIS